MENDPHYIICQIWAAYGSALGNENPIQDSVQLGAWMRNVTGNEPVDVFSTEDDKLVI